MEFDLNLFIRSYIEKEIKKLYISYLYSVEDLNASGVLSDETFNKMRKRILDSGNDCIRNIQDQLECLDFKIIKK
jgi:hypothetical protein